MACDHELELPEGAVEVNRITVVKTFDDNAPGGIGLSVHYGEGLTLIDALGMLSFAQTVVPIDFGLIEQKED